jgi:hypothetical protein
MREEGATLLRIDHGAFRRRRITLDLRQIRKTHVAENGQDSGDKKAGPQQGKNATGQSSHFRSNIEHHVRPNGKSHALKT